MTLSEDQKPRLRQLRMTGRQNFFVGTKINRMGARTPHRPRPFISRNFRSACGISLLNNRRRAYVPCPSTHLSTNCALNECRYWFDPLSLLCSPEQPIPGAMLVICSPIVLLLLEEQMEMGRDVRCTTQKPQLTLFTINHYTVSCLMQKLS